MSDKHRWLNLLVCVVFGFLGGVASNAIFFTGRVVAAQQTADVIKAHEFEVIDDKGKSWGSLYAQPGTGGARLVLYGPKQKIADLDLRGNGGGSLDLYEYGRYIHLDMQQSSIFFGGVRDGKRVTRVGAGYNLLSTPEASIFIADDEGRRVWEAK